MPTEVWEVTMRNKDLLSRVKEFGAATERGVDPECVCNKCGEPYHCPDGMDPTPLCNKCAQDLSDLIPALLEHVAEVEAANEVLMETVVILRGGRRCHPRNPNASSGNCP